MAKKTSKSNKPKGIPYIPPGGAPSDQAEANRLRTYNNLMSQVTGDPFYGYNPNAEKQKQANIDRQLGTGAKGKVVKVPNVVNYPATPKLPKSTSVSSYREVVVPVKDAFGKTVKSDSFSGRTPEGGTRSLLEGFRSFMGGGLRKHGR
jgi:hypothetical protein